MSRAQWSAAAFVAAVFVGLAAAFAFATPAFGPLALATMVLGAVSSFLDLRA